MLMYSRCEKGGRCSFHVGGFASGLQCTSADLPADITLSQPYLAHCSAHRAGDSVGGVRGGM